MALLGKLTEKEMKVWTTLVDLPLDRLAEEPAPAFGFIKRLMREEKWDYTMAVRVVAEYRRFLLLAHLGPVSPPDRVDAAWHLHLTYTRAYNIGLCERTLGRALHHTPSGGVEESERYLAVYEDTLNRYRAVFNEEPPVDIWPALKPASPLSSTGTAGARKKSRGGPIAVAMVLVFAWFALRPSFWVMLVFMGVAAVLMTASAHARKKSGDRSVDSGCGGDSGGDGGGGDGGGCGGSCGGGCG